MFKMNKIRSRIFPIEEETDDEEMKDDRDKTPTKVLIDTNLMERNDYLTKGSNCGAWQSYPASINSISKWKDYKSSRRKLKSTVRSTRDFPIETNHKLFPVCPFVQLAEMHSGLGSCEGFDEGESIKDEKSQATAEPKNNRFKPMNTTALIIYFSEIGKHLEQTSSLDLPFIEHLIQEGADVNATDKYGQTIMHEVARAWHIDVARFLKFHGADITKPDDFGRTPLHVSAAVDYQDMVQWLIDNGADISAATFEEQQQPLHSAARNDSVNSLKMLIHLGAEIDAKDYKERTPLQLAAELDRSESAKYLIQNGAAVGVKDSGSLPVINLLIEKMPHVAKMALDEFHLKDKTNRKQYFYLNYLEPFPPKHMKVSPKSPLQEMWEWSSSVRSHKRWVEWRSNQINLDLPFCHPCYPDENHYLLQELNSIKKSSVAYFKDAWNYFDWFTYSWIAAVIFTKVYAVVDTSTVESEIAKLHPKLLAVGLIFIWLQLMKTLRAVEALGPFIVMLGHIADDTIKFAFLYCEFFIPYVCAFWMLFGGSDNAAKMKAKSKEDVDWKSFNDLAYSVWQMTVIGDFGFEALAVIDRFMAQILVGTFMASSGILLLNLFIASMSDTFQRVHDNTKANAAMQRASLILNIENTLSNSAKRQFHSYIQEQCSPMIAFYDDDAIDEDGELQKMTIQIKETVDEMKHEIETAKQAFISKQIANAKELTELKEDFKIHQQKIENEMSNIKHTLKNIMQLMKNENEECKVDESRDSLPSFASLMPQDDANPSTHLANS